MSFKEIQLGDALRIRHGFAFKGEHFVEEGNLIVLTPGNFFEQGGFRVRPGKDRAYAGDVPDGYVLNEGDIIVAMTEQGPGLLGSSAIVPQSDRYLHNQRLGLVHEINERLVDRTFLYYLFNTATVRGQISGSATGTKVRHTAPDRIYRVHARIPQIQAQRKIARTLKGYDDLIVNNTRRIELLERSGRLLFEEWFVRLRYPGHEHDKVIDGVPQGWRKLSFSVLGDFLNGFAFKPKHLGSVGLPIVKIPELKEGVGNSTPRYEGHDVPERYIIGDGDLIFSWSGTLAVEFSNCGKAYLNQHLFLVSPKKLVSAEYLLLSIRDKMPQFANQTVGSTMKHIRRSALDNVRTPVAPPSLQSEFERQAGDLYRMILNLGRQNQRLAMARDLLLPRLMDGRIEV